MSTTAEQITCRTLGHSWDHLPHKPGENVIRLRCVRCTMERFDAVSVTTGEVERRKYVPPTGYYLTRDDGPAPTRAEWRKHFMLVAGIVDKKGKLQ